MRYCSPGHHVDGGSLAEILVVRSVTSPFLDHPSMAAFAPGDALPIPQEHDADERFA
jgi:hypothetical protein